MVKWHGVRRRLQRSVAEKRCTIGIFSRSPTDLRDLRHSCRECLWHVPMEAYLWDKCAPAGDYKRPSTKISSSKSFQWIPSPSPINRQLFLCSGVASRSDGNQFI